MTLQTTTIELAGLSLIGAYDGKKHYIMTEAFAKVLGEETPVLRRRIKESKALKALAGRVVETTNKREGRTQKNAISTQDFSVVLTWLALEGNTKAQALLTATFTEAVDRRIDNALGVNRTEADYESQTKDFFRELARKSFQPDFTEWLADSSVIPNYGAEVNRMKKALNLPLSPIDTYDHTQIEAWAKGLSRYDILRMEGYSHKRALNVLSLAIAARV
jgi:hypothetical protein